MPYNPKHRQIMMWFDPSKIKHYETLFMIQTLVDLINAESSTTNVTVSFRPYFNMYRNPQYSGIALREDIVSNLFCSDKFPDYCLDRRTYGTNL